MTTRLLPRLLFVCPGLFAIGCAADSSLPLEDDPEVIAGGKADQISGADDPSGLLGDAERRLAKLLTADEVGQSFGVDDDKVPYPDTYWPMVDNGIAVEWLEKDGSKCSTRNECEDAAASPLAKFVSPTAPGKEADA